MKAPFPYFGGKSRVAAEVWKRFGNVENYIEPFFGSGAVLLSRPHEPKVETVNDIDCYISNFWRAIQRVPDEVAEWANWPVNEADLHARHLWLLQYRPTKVQGDPDYFDAKIAGWWLWGLCSWIGSGWCSGDGPWVSIDGEITKASGERGVVRKLPHLCGGGRGVNRQVPYLRSKGAGINQGTVFETRLEFIKHMIAELSVRLRDTRVACGDWSRVLGAATRCRGGITAVFLDPPYTTAADYDKGIYTHEDRNVGLDVFQWALEHGEDPKMRLAVCGYEGEYRFPEAWECVPWKANGGFGGGRNGRGERNRHRERIWFSPNCLKESAT